MANPCRLSATAYSTYWQLTCKLEAVSPFATWGRTMPWWQRPIYHGNKAVKCIKFRNITSDFPHSTKGLPGYGLEIYNFNSNVYNTYVKVLLSLSNISNLSRKSVVKDYQSQIDAYITLLHIIALSYDSKWYRIYTRALTRGIMKEIVVA
jgi:hypothetical protein